jgi:hypothetical protein
MSAVTYRAVARELDAAHDQLAREHKSLTSEAAMPELPDPSLAWEGLSVFDRRALTEMLVDKIIAARGGAQGQGQDRPPESEQQVGHRGRTPPQ